MKYCDKNGYLIVNHKANHIYKLAMTIKLAMTMMVNKKTQNDALGFWSD